MTEANLRVNIFFEYFKEKFPLPGIKTSTTILLVKNRIESLIGIPSSLLQLFYLDKCSLVDEKTLRNYHVLPDAKIIVRVWKTHEMLLQTSRIGNWDDIQKELKGSSDACFDKEKMLISLFVCCFYGHKNAVEKLLLNDVAYRDRLLSGNEAIKVAVSQGHITCCELLLQRKVRPQEWQNERTSLTNWPLQDRIKDTLNRIRKKRVNKNNLKFSRTTTSQLYDSALRTWFRGEHAQMYLCGSN